MRRFVDLDPVVLRRLLAALALGVSLSLAGRVARGQDGATLFGRVVHKTSNAGIPGANVLLVPSAQRVLTDAAGHFRFDRVPPGRVTILVRRLGFAPESASFAVYPAQELDLLIQLEPTIQRLDTVTVAARESPLGRGKLAGFYERKRLGIGRFFDSELLEKERNRPLGEVIASRSPGARLIRSRASTAAWLATTRRSGSTFSREPMNAADRLNGADSRVCYPDIYLDGTLIYWFGSGLPLFDINNEITTSTVSAVEFYIGPSQTPPQFNKSNAVCGVLLIWTKSSPPLGPSTLDLRP